MSEMTKEEVSKSHTESPTGKTVKPDAHNGSSPVQGNKPTRTLTKSIDNSQSTKSTDVGVQATPAAVAADLNAPHKGQRGVLSVTPDMRNTSTETQRCENRQSSKQNCKEKTPMCLINELARYNKIEHKYVLEDEKGPAHKKEFHIRLDLGTESHVGSGTSIKRAQHTAAETALNVTKLKRPVDRPARLTASSANIDKKKAAVTPTVELNALAMKLGQHPDYLNIDQPVRPLAFRHVHLHHQHYNPAGLYHRPPPAISEYHQRPYTAYHPFANQFMQPAYRPRMPRAYHVLLKIDKREFKGEGATRQQAKHNAAQKALKVLRNTPNQLRTPSPNLTQNKTKSSTDTNKIADLIEKQPTSSSDTTSPDTATAETASPSTDTSAIVPATTDTTSETAAACCSVTSSCDENEGSVDESIDGKSEISQVHELALQHALTINFEVIHESGPPHLRNFVTRCDCGENVTEGEGNSKKKSKKKAAELMLDKLQALHLPSVASKQKVKNVANKKKNRNLIKMQKANIEYGSGINPISRLIQIQQANRRREPLYTLVTEQGLPRRREFVIQVECNDLACHGKGPNKKLAKRNAAEEMLQMMGYSKPSPEPGKSVLKSSDHTSPHHNKHVTFVDSVSSSSKPPGVIVRPASPSSTTKQDIPQFKAELAASIAKELLDTGKSVVGETLLPTIEHPKSALQSPREKLEYLATCMGFLIEFTDFPKGTNTDMFMTLVALHTNPTRSYHDSASSIEESRNKASLHALNQLAQSSEPDDNSSEETTSPHSENDKEVKAEIKLDMKNGSGDGLEIHALKLDANGDINEANLEINNVKPGQKTVKLEHISLDEQTKPSTDSVESN